MLYQLRKKLAVALGVVVLALGAVGAMLWGSNAREHNPVINVSAEDVALSIESNNLSYSDTTYILYAVSNVGFDREQFPVSLLFWNEPQEEYVLGTENYSKTESRSVELGGKDCGVFYSKGFPAKHIVDTIYARACVEIGEQVFYSDVSKFGVVEYVYTMREKGSLTDDQEYMMEMMLEYGSVAQRLFGYKTDTLANAPFYKISVREGVLSDGFAWGRYALNEKIALEANPAPEGCKFSHWSNALGVAVGYEPSMTVSVTGADTFTAVYRSVGQIPTNVADFETMNNGKTSNSYATALTSQKGWTASAAIQFGSTSTNYTFLGEEDVALVLNGKKSALDWVQSPVLQGGVAKISFNYALPFSDTKFSLKIEVTDEDGNVVTEVIEKTSVAQKTDYELVVELSQPVLGNVTVKISNGGLSNSSSNKDRVAIWDVKVFGAEIVEEGDTRLDVHFLELGNYYTGDCTFIKAGDVDILIDAGSRQSSASTIAAYINQYCTDGVLEYVVATHAHQDHIAGFVGSSGDGIFDLYRVGTLIDFPKTDATTQVYKNYVTKRSALIENGTKHYTALEWWNGADGLTRSIELASGIFMTVLYQEYYEKSIGSENNYSVCLMISQGDNNYLFTGDLETAGEESLLKNNTLPKVNVYKAGHHGSKTASSAALLAVIQPEIICVCCCCGSDEYSTVNESQYPMQVTVERWAKYTSRIYVTSLAVNDESGDTVGVTSMNGNIVVSSYGQEIMVNCSNNNVVLKDSEWFKANRVWPSDGVDTAGTAGSSGSFDEGASGEGSEGSSGEGAENGSGASGETGFFSQGLAYSLNSDGAGYTVTGMGECTDTDLVIPATYNGLPVTMIGNSAFRGCSKLTSVVIPESVMSIGEDAFAYCSSLTDIAVSENNTAYKDIDGNLYTKDGATLIQYAIGKTAMEFTIPDGVTSIGERAFYYCSSLTSVVISDSVTSISYFAFYNCSSLTSVEIPDSVTSIGNSAFFGCTSLTSVVIPNRLTSIEERTFFGCRSLTNLLIPNNVISIGNDVFSNCSNLTSVTIGDGVTSIGDGAFYYCISLTDIVVSENNTAYKDIDGNLYTKDGATLIQYAIGKTETCFIIPETVENIEGWLVYGCNSLTRVVIPDSVTSIGYSAFDGCSNLTIYCEAMSKPSGWNVDWNFSRCPVVWGYNPTPANAFNYTSDGFAITIAKYIGEYTEVVIPVTIGGLPVTSIGDYAFAYCGNLTSVVIPDSVMNISESAFSGCSSLTSVEIGDSVTSIGWCAFYGCSSLTSVVIPDSVKSIDDYAFGWCSSLTSVVIPDSVTSIGGYAFRDCSNLTIYCETSEQPSGWNADWNYLGGTVVWGYKGKE